MASTRLRLLTFGWACSTPTLRHIVQKSDVGATSVASRMIFAGSTKKVVSMRGFARTLAPRIRLCRRLFLAVCTLWAFTSAFVSHAGDNTWSPLGPEGGYISKVVFHNTSPGTLYL